MTKILGTMLLSASLLSAFSYTGQFQELARSNTAQAVEQKKIFNNDKAVFTAAALCDVSVGAYWRMYTPDQRRLVDVTCSNGESQR